MHVRFAAAIAALGALGTASAVAIGCGSGSGPLVTTTSGGREEPGTTRDTPPPSRDNPASDCIECDVFYVCTTTGGTSSSGGGSGSSGGPPGGGTTSINLSSRNGTCTQPVIDLVCSGTLFGQPACSGGGGGPFQCGTMTCVPQPR